MKQPVDESPRTRMRKRIFQIQRLSAMPKVVWELVHAVGDDSTTVGRVVKIIESDQALASRVLNLANSAYYGFAHRINTIDRAVVAVGFQELRLVALSVGLSQVFDPRKAAPGWDAEQAWLHTLSVSWFSRELAAKNNRQAPGEAMVAGLLHDLGKLVLASYLPEEYGPVLARQAQGLTCLEAERESGYLHTTAGYWLAKRWELPEVHVAAIRDHHDKHIKGEHAPTVALVALGDLMSQCVCTMPAESMGSTELGGLLSLAGVSADDVREVASRGRRELPPALEHWVSVLNSEGGSHAQ
jgi:HD-like signal output (HDOD) protein